MSALDRIHRVLGLGRLLAQVNADLKQASAHLTEEKFRELVRDVTNLIASCQNTNRSD